MTRARKVVILVALVLSAAPVLAQTGSIRILVLDSRDDSPLPGANVTVSNEQRLVAPTSLITGRDGLATFPILRAGTGYVIEVQMPGFALQRLTAIRLRSNSTEALAFRMGAPLEERVEVIGGRDIVDLDEVGGSTRFSDQFIEDLPTLGRFYQEVLPLAPGVNDHDGDGNPNVHGARSRDFRTEVSADFNELSLNMDGSEGRPGFLSSANAGSFVSRCQSCPAIPLTGAEIDFNDGDPVGVSVPHETMIGWPPFNELPGPMFIEFGGLLDTNGNGSLDTGAYYVQGGQLDYDGPSAQLGVRYTF